MAATFVNLDSGKSIRIRARETSQAQVRDYSPNVTDELEQQLLAYQNLPQDTLFDVQSIEVEVHYSDLSGSTRFKSESVSIGVIVRDKREIYKTTKVSRKNNFTFLMEKLSSSNLALTCNASV